MFVSIMTFLHLIVLKLGAPRDRQTDMQMSKTCIAAY